MYTLIFYVPEAHLEQVKNAVFIAGAGKIGHYDCCAWQTKGEGQFRPSKDAKPFIGQSGEIEKVSEYKVEMVCKEEHIENIVSALLKAHPYETPAFMYWKVEGQK